MEEAFSAVWKGSSNTHLAVAGQGLSICALCTDVRSHSRAGVIIPLCICSNVCTVFNIPDGGLSCCPRRVSGSSSVRPHKAALRGDIIVSNPGPPRDQAEDLRVLLPIFKFIRQEGSEGCHVDQQLHWQQQEVMGVLVKTEINPHFCERHQGTPVVHKRCLKHRWGRVAGGSQGWLGKPPQNPRLLQGLSQ